MDVNVAENGLKPRKVVSQSVQEAIHNNSFFWTDGSHVFYERNQVPLPNADPDQSWFWDIFAFDGKHVYLRNQWLRGVSPADFSVLNPAFVRTRSHVLSQNGRIKCTPEEYVRVLDAGNWYGQDDLIPRGYILVGETVWYETHWSQGLVKLSGVHAEKFVSCRDGVLGMDDERVYAFGKIVKGASARDFHKVWDDERWGYYMSGGYLYYEDVRMMPVSAYGGAISIVDAEQKRIAINGQHYISGRAVSLES